MIKLVEVGGFEPPSLVLDQVDRLTPPVVVLRGIAWQSRLDATEKRSLVYQKSPHLSRCELTGYRYSAIIVTASSMPPTIKLQITI